MKFTLEYPSDVPDAAAEFLTPSVIRDVVSRAERAGFAAVAVSEHPAPSVKWRRSGGHDTLDPIAALAFMAGVSTTIALMTNLLVLPFRNPYSAAKALASLDIVSGGRLIVGAGAGYLRSEFAAMGVDFDRRGALLDEALATVRAIWTDPETPVTGSTFGAVGPVSTQRPVQRPHPPIWIGGNSAAARRRVVEHGDGWMPLIAPPAVTTSVGTQPLEDAHAFGRAVHTLRSRLADVGRDPSTVNIQVEQHRLDLDDHAAVVHARAGLDDLESRGATLAIVHIDASSTDAALDYIDAFGELFIDGRAMTAGPRDAARPDDQLIRR